MGISLTEALAELRRELYAAQTDGAREQFRFEVLQAELSLEVEFRRDGNGGVKVEVGALGTALGAEAGAAQGSTRRQVLTLSLQVRDEALGGERARIRGTAGTHEDGLDTAREAPGDGNGSTAASSEADSTVPQRPWEL